MSPLDGLIVGLLVATTAIAVLLFVALVVVIESLKDIKAYHFTVIERLGTLDERMRDGHLRILKCLKGESYQGSFGGMDVHTDPALPRGQWFAYNRDTFPPDHQEEAHA